MLGLGKEKPVLPLADVEKMLMMRGNTYRYDGMVFPRMHKVKLMFSYMDTVDDGVLYLDPFDTVEAEIADFGTKQRENLSERAEYLRYRKDSLTNREFVAFMISGRYSTKERRIFGRENLVEIEPSPPLVSIDYMPDEKNGTARIDKLRVNGKKLQLTEANAKRALSLAHYCLQEMTMNKRLPFKKAMNLIFGDKRNKQMALATRRP